LAAGAAGPAADAAAAADRAAGDVDDLGLPGIRLLLRDDGAAGRPRPQHRGALAADLAERLLAAAAGQGGRDRGDHVRHPRGGHAGVRQELPGGDRMSTPMSARRLRRAPLYVAVTIICVICLFPFAWMLLTSLKPNSDIFTATPKFFTTDPDWSRYSSLWSTQFPRNFLNSLIAATGTTAVGIVIAATAGYALARFRIPMRRYLLIVVLMVQMIPQVVLVIPLFIMIRSAHLLNTYAGLILCYLPLTISLGIWMMRSFFLS